jgi:hypothetical protein
MVRRKVEWGELSGQRQQAEDLAPEDNFDKNGEGLLSTHQLSGTVLSVFVALFYEILRTLWGKNYFLSHQWRRQGTEMLSLA